MLVSLFDLDHTLLNANSSYRFGAYLFRNKTLSLTSMLYLVSCYGWHKFGKMSITELHHKVFKKVFSGYPLDKLNLQVESFLDQHLQEMLYQPALARLRSAQQCGHFTAILSSSPHFLVEPIAKRLQVTEWLATHYEIDKDRRLCKISHIMDGFQKAIYLSDLKDRLSVSQQNVIAYSDSDLDLHFLKSAGKAVGVNPNKTLRQICQENDWEII